MPSRYTRFDIRRPGYLAEVHWDSISIEIDRLTRSLDADDDGQVLADAKCLVESVAKVTHEIAGEPAPESLKSLVSGAHELLRGQPGHELERATPFAQIANSANKMAQQLGEIRNAFGGGHGRAQQPRVRSEAVDLALDAAFTWTRWALRRLGLFSEGRPEALIRDLIVESATFRSGTLKRRLEAANLGTLEARHQRALGVAVGQRVMRNTFVVREDGLEPALLSDDLTTWPPDYRAGLATGLLLDTQGILTVTAYSIDTALTLLDPIDDGGALLAEIVEGLDDLSSAAYTRASVPELYEARRSVLARAANRPESERAAHERLSSLLDPTTSVRARVMR